MNNIFLLEPGKTYHIYGHAIGKEKAFLSDRNYMLFLNNYARFVAPLADTYAYSILPREYHFIIRICDAETIDRLFPERLEKNLSYQHFISHQIGRFILSYTKAFNKHKKRNGALFMKPFRRGLLNDEFDLVYTAKKIHLLPVKKRLCRDLEKWKFSSYPKIINYRASVLTYDISNYFSSMDHFIKFHEMKNAA